MTISERIFELIHKSGMTQKEFSERTGIPQSTISDWKKKKCSPTSDKIEIISEVLKEDPTYIITGSKGTKYKKVEAYRVFSDTEEYEFISRFKELDSSKRERLLGYMDALLELQIK